MKIILISGFLARLKLLACMAHLFGLINSKYRRNYSHLHYAWNETERKAILEKISRCWAPEATYTDKITNTITGQEAITDLILSSYAQMGPRTFKVSGPPDTHHQSGRSSWLAIRPDGYPVQGMDYFEFNEENRITRIVGFF